MRFWNILCPMLGPEKEPQATKIDVGLGAFWLGCMGVLYQGLNLKKQHLLVLLTIQLLFGQLTLSLSIICITSLPPAGKNVGPPSYT